MASAESDRQEEEVAAAGDEEDTGAHVAPIVRLEEVAVTTGEEDEDALIDLKAKLYRFDKEGKQWKERGNGSVKLLKHKETGRVRLVMRQAKTHKICANHLVLPSTSMQEHAGNDKSCVWHAMDFSDGVLKEELFAIRFGSVERVALDFEAFLATIIHQHMHLQTSRFVVTLSQPLHASDCKKFMEMIEEIIADCFGKTEDEYSKDALSASHLIEKLSMTEPENKADTKERVKEDEEKQIIGVVENLSPAVCSCVEGLPKCNTSKVERNIPDPRAIPIHSTPSTKARRESGFCKKKLGCLLRTREIRSSGIPHSSCKKFKLGNATFSMLLLINLLQLQRFLRRISLDPKTFPNLQLGEKRVLDVEGKNDAHIKDPEEHQRFSGNSKPVSSIYQSSEGIWVLSDEAGIPFNDKRNPVFRNTTFIP
ncbi:hypothetical protein ZIOFF_058631 [Zingiber officinale]|uniref:Ran-specific GTPase-activating protein n=1 Tax=Zingiber officinale TaxID=94328 RepID=A0A8J5FGN5_ZINOF|nr:hypothetical protein ZIOFF_058631 [Zingiber officinale]